MSTELLEHNQITFEEVENFISKGQDCCVVNPCGSGKTFVMAAIINNHADKTFTLVTKQSNAKAYYLRKSPAFAKVTIITYNKLLKDFKSNELEKYDTDFMLLDEAHYMGADKWFLPIGCIKKRFQPIMIGFTATPQRFYQQGTNDTIVTDYFQGNAAGNFTSKDLRDKGLFVEPECVVSYYNLDMELEKRIANIENSDMEDSTKELYISKLNAIKTQWVKDSHPSIILNKYVPNHLYKESCNRILVYSPNMTMLEQNKTLVMTALGDMLEGKSIQTYDYTYKTDRKAFDKFLEEDDDTYVKVLFSIDKIMETIHIDDLSIVIMLRPSVSNRIITQQYGRVNNTNNTNKSLIIDLVGNIDTLNSVSFDSMLGNKGDTLNHNKPKKIKCNINLYHVGTYQNLFAQIDNCLKRYPIYTYNNLTGSATFFATVYSCDKVKLKNSLALGFDMEDAIEASKLAEKKINQKIFDNSREYDVSESEPELPMEVLTEMVSTFIKRRNIVDEDMQQDLYVLAYSKSYSSKMELANRLSSSYTAWCKRQRRHDEVFVPFTDETVPVQEESEAFKKPFNSELRRGLEKGFGNLTDRERDVVIEYFGLDTDIPLTLDEVAAIHKVTRERIRQISLKGLRKLRHPRYTRYYKDWVDESYKKALPKIHQKDVILVEDTNTATPKNSETWLDMFKKELAEETKKPKEKPVLYNSDATIIELLQFYDYYEIANEISRRKGIYETEKRCATKETDKILCSLNNHNTTKTNVVSEKEDFMNLFNLKDIKLNYIWEIRRVIRDVLLKESLPNEDVIKHVTTLVDDIRTTELKGIKKSIFEYEDYKYLDNFAGKL